MEKLKQMREERGLSQVKLAARADLNPATVNQIERGMRDASPGTLRKLADALEVSLYDLLEEEAPKVLSPQPEREAAATSKALQEAVAIAWRLLAQQGQAIVEQSIREGASEQLGQDLANFHDAAARLSSIKRVVGVQVTDELAEAEDAYQEVEDRIQALLRQDIEGSAEEKAQLQRFKRDKADGNTEERGANAS